MITHTSWEQYSSAFNHEQKDIVTIKKLILIAMASAFCFSVNVGFSAARVTSANIPLQGGHIGPKGTLYIKKDQLIPGAEYKITCSVSLTGSATDKSPFYIRIPALSNEAGYRSSSLIDQKGTSENGQGSFDSGTPNHSISLYGVYKITYNGISHDADTIHDIVVQNLDQTRSMDVSDCVATPLGR